jgi:hypothetical protein
MQDALEAIAAFCHREDGIFSLALNARADVGKWSASLAWGREAPDSPMVAAQAIGMGDTPAEAIAQIVEEARLTVVEPDRKSWSVPICTGCGGIFGMAPGLDAACTCDRTVTKTGKTIKLIEAPARQEGSDSVQD